MTIASLLRHHGVDVPRYVTVDGQIVFDGVTVTSAGAAHASLGPVTAVPNHTFHGGFEPTTGDALDVWWNYSERLMPHIEAMRAAFPSFEYKPPRGSSAPSWSGTINTGRGRFRLTILLRPDGSLPTARILGPALGASERGRWVPAPHLFLNGNLCIADQNDWNPTVHTAATAVAWSAHWLAAYTEWRMTRRWPVEGSRPRAR